MLEFILFSGSVGVLVSIMHVWDKTIPKRDKTLNPENTLILSLLFLFSKIPSIEEFMGN